MPKRASYAKLYIRKMHADAWVIIYASPDASYALGMARSWRQAMRYAWRFIELVRRGG